MSATATLPSILESKMYIAVDPVGNNNKFWKYERYSAAITEKDETGDLKITWGRVGADNPESQLKSYDEKWLKSKINSKLRGKKDESGNRVAYTECQIIDMGAPAASNGKSLAKSQVAKLAVEEIAQGCAITAALVKQLAEANRHELLVATGGQMDIDLETGMVRTAVGVVTMAAVKSARLLLDEMAPFVKKSNTENPHYIELIGKYLRLVPQKVGSKRGWYNEFIILDAQTQLLDQLEASVELAEQRMKDALTNGSKTPEKVAQTFNVKMAICTDNAVIEKIKRMYSTGGSARHESARLKPVRVYEIEIPHMAVSFKSDGQKVGNLKLLWHGTRMFNVLSILKRGFVLPSQLSTVQTTGAMYGPGLYFSANSTKSLNYSYGYWDGGRRDSNCYMFLVDVAMGKEYIPSYSGNGKKPGYDSCWAKPGSSGVINDEQIVYRTSQANIRYLIEFNEK